MEKRVPQGFVEAVTFASMAIAILGLAFLFYWGVVNFDYWNNIDLLVVAPTIFGVICLAYVPWMIFSVLADRESQADMVKKARKPFLAGSALMILGVSTSLFLS